MDSKNVLYFLPPRVMARVIAFILALLISIGGARIMQLFFKGGGQGQGEDKPNENGGDVSVNAGGGEKDEGKEEKESHFNIEGAASVGTVIGGKSAMLFTLEDKSVLACKDLNGSVAINDATLFAVALVVAKAVNEGRISLSDEAVCPASAAKSDGYSLSSQILPIGKRMKVGDILKCMFYQSGSSYAYTLAVHISGSEEAFVAEMNAYASSLELKDTLFTNCTGDKDGKAYVSPYDLGVLLKHLLSDGLLKNIICSDDMITVGYGQSESIALVVKNDFFERWCTPSQAKSDGIIGGKMGSDSFYTWSCVIFYKDGKTYVSLVLESKDAFADALMLYSAYAA